MFGVMMDIWVSDSLYLCILGYLGIRAHVAEVVGGYKDNLHVWKQLGRFWSKYETVHDVSQKRFVDLDGCRGGEVRYREAGGCNILVLDTAEARVTRAANAAFSSSRSMESRRCHWVVIHARLSSTRNQI